MPGIMPGILNEITWNQKTLIGMDVVVFIDFGKCSNKFPSHTHTVTFFTQINEKHNSMYNKWQGYINSRGWLESQKRNSKESFNASKIFNKDLLINRVKIDLILIQKMIN